MRKVLHILPMNKISGAEKIALLTCKNIKQYKPIVICGGEELKEVFIKNGIKAYSMKFTIKRPLTTARKVSQIIKEEDIDIVHAHDNIASLIAYISKKLFIRNVKVISHIHNCYPWLKAGWINKKIDELVRDKYDYNITCGKLVYDFYKENSRVFNEEKVISLSNAIDLETIEKFKNKDNKELLKKYNIKQSDTVLGYIGRLDEQKGIIPFINAIIENKHKLNTCKILLVGNGAEEKQVIKKIYENNMEDLFILVGHQEDIYSFYPIIDIFFLPSKYEGLPMVILEAMAFEKAVVSMDVGSINELINSETGVLVKSGDYDTFINKLIELKDNTRKQREYGSNAFKLVKSKYDIENYVENLEECYKHVLKESI